MNRTGYAPFDWEKNVRRVGPLIENFLRQNYFFCAMGARARSRMNPVNRSQFYQMSFSCTVDVKLRNFNYKYLMRIIPNNRYMFKCNLVPPVPLRFLFNARGNQFPPVLAMLVYTGSVVKRSGNTDF